MKKINCYSRTLSRTDKIKKVLDKKQSNLTIVFENVTNPHNLYAILRTCDSVGIADIYAIYKHSNMPKPEKSGKRSSSSGTKWVNIISQEDITLCIDNLKKNNFTICSTDLREHSISIYDYDFTQKTAIIVGNETMGVSEKVAKQSDYNLYIPMVGMIKSLNVSVAVAVILYEAFRQRQLKGLYNERQLSDIEYNSLFNKWIIK